MEFLDRFYWKMRLFLSKWWVRESEKIDESVARFKWWLDGN